MSFEGIAPVNNGWKRLHCRVTQLVYRNYARAPVMKSGLMGCMRVRPRDLALRRSHIFEWDFIVGGGESYLEKVNE